MDETTLEALEYPEVLKELSAYSVTPIGAEFILGFRPSMDAGSIREAYAEILELSALIAQSGKLPLGGIADIRPLLSRPFPEGAYYLVDELQLISASLIALVQLKSILAPGFRRSYPGISSRLGELSDQSALSGELGRILDEKGHIVDDASQELKRIRKEILSVRRRARGVLDVLLKDKKTAELLQEELVTIREDRYVFMIKAGGHKEFDGVVHGRSSSGSTYFIEPFALVEINNRLAILKRDEGAEEVRILKAATGRVLESKESLEADLDGAGYLDTVQARACFSQELKAVAPVLKTTGGVRLRKARHPLLVLKELRSAGRAVPVDIIIDESCRVLVISGANTGGKTVALKTLGLLTLMALSAIPIPAEDGSEVFFFSSIFADIGDRQDIIANLSTFSAHIGRIHGFLGLTGPGALVLIDEIGVGTDPAEGGAIALAALETFKERGAISVVTTHLNVLKAHAQVTAGYENASVEFDEETLKPLYNLRSGVPGPSLGLSIARGLGMDPELIERAGGYLKEEEGAFIESVRALEEERAALGVIIERSKALEAKRVEAIERLRDKRGVLLGKVKLKLEAVVKEATQEIKLVLAELKAGHTGPGASMAVDRVEGIGSRAAQRLQKTERYLPEVGDRVTIIGSRTKGVVAGVDRAAERAELSVGSLKVWVDWKKLKPSSGAAPRKFQEAHINADIEVSTSVNLIGMRAEEAIKVLTRFLDNAHANGLDRVEVIHGVGTGRLAGAVKGFLSESEVVKRFYHGDPARGGGGVTVVELE